MPECKQCGACCRGELWVEATPADAAREPRIEAEAACMDGKGTLPPAEVRWSLACGKPCPFLTAENRCEIYETRPDDCRGFQPGSDQCREVRGDAVIRRVSVLAGKGDSRTEAENREREELLLLVDGILAAPGETDAEREARLAHRRQLQQDVARLERRLMARRHGRTGRNQPCYCGSGLKHKKCCLRKDG